METTKTIDFSPQLPQRMMEKMFNVDRQVAEASWQGIKKIILGIGRFVRRLFVFCSVMVGLIFLLALAFPEEAKPAMDAIRPAVKELFNFVATWLN
jgi:hypothetical protein